MLCMKMSELIILCAYFFTVKLGLVHNGFKDFKELYLNSFMIAISMNYDIFDIAVGQPPTFYHF